MPLFYMIIGHKKIRERLARSVEKNAFVQTYLFVGPESVGKFEVAKEFALHIIGDNVAMENNNTQQTDLFVLEPEREVEKGVVKERDISVERAREASRWLGQFPYAASKKVLIIRDAHRLTESAQNALLKILEEPPAYAVIIVVTHEIGNILPTTISRCHQVSFQLVSPMEMSEATILDPALASALSKHTFLLALGRPGLVIQSFQKDEEFSESFSVLEQLVHLSEKSLRNRLNISELCAKNRGQTLQILMWWSGGLHTQIAKAVSDKDALLSVRNIEKIEALRINLKRFPSSTRLLLDTFFLYW
jgi:DNA polymerase-3 subunit delta'